MRFEPAIEIPVIEDQSLVLAVRTASLDRSGFANASVQAWNGELLHSDNFRPGKEGERKRFIKAVLGRAGVEKDLLEKALIELNEVLITRLSESSNGESSEIVAPADPEIELLDSAPPILRRLLSIIEGTAYAVTWGHIQEIRRQGYDDAGNVITYGKPLTESRRVLRIVSDAGQVYGEKGTKTLEEIDIEIGFASIPPVNEEKLWSRQGVKRFQDGERPDPGELFWRLVRTIDRFIDFDHSLADQETMCELIACYVMSTWFLDAFNVIGYLWPNGEKGSGKTQLLNVIAELSHVGQLILSGGTYTTLRDLADCGATLCFDEAESITRNNQPDDDKKALLLAGNRRGSSVTFKEIAPDGKTWRTRFVNTFSPRCFGAINMPSGALESRTIIIPLIVSTDRHRIDDDVLDYPKWPHARRRLLDDLWALGLANLKELKAADDYVAKNARMSGRNLEPFRASLAVAYWLDQKGTPGAYKRIEQLSVDYQLERRGFDGGDLRVLIIRALVHLMGGDACDACDALILGIPPEEKIKTSEIRNVVIEIAEAEEIFSKTDWITPSKVGKALQKMRFTHARIAHTGQKAWLIKFKELARWKKSLGLTGEMLKQASQASQASPLYGNPNNDIIKRCDACKIKASPSDEPVHEASPGDVEGF